MKIFMTLILIAAVAFVSMMFIAQIALDLKEAEAGSLVGEAIDQVREEYNEIREDLKKFFKKF